MLWETDEQSFQDIFVLPLLFGPQLYHNPDHARCGFRSSRGYQRGGQNMFQNSWMDTGHHRLFIHAAKHFARHIIHHHNAETRDHNRNWWEEEEKLGAMASAYSSDMAAW